MRRLSKAGFKPEFVRRAILPDWWDDECEQDPKLLADVEFRVARFVGQTLGDVRDPSASLRVPLRAGVQLRRVRTVSRDRIAPALHAALQVAEATVRNLRHPVGPVRVPPTDASAWRGTIEHAARGIRLVDLLRDLWDRGIPVVHVEQLPTPGFQGLACVLQDRPVVVLGYAIDDPARLAFIIAHEVAHIANRDCTPDHPVVDELEEAVDDHEIEKRADAYASGVLVDATFVPRQGISGFKELALEALAIEKERDVDAAAVIWSWARLTGDYAKAVMAARALYRSSGGARVLREKFERYVDLDSASESDRALLRCVRGESASDAPVD